jgi:hypothetical protein
VNADARIYHGDWSEPEEKVGDFSQRSAFLRRLLPTFFAALLMALFIAVAAEYSAVLVQAQWARLVLLAIVGVALYVAVSMFVQRPLLKDITGAFFFH